MADEAASIQDQIDELNGNDSSIEDPRHATAMKNIKDEATANGTLGSAAYKHLLDLEDQLHNLKIKHIQQQQAAQRASDAASSGSTGASKTQSPTGIGGGGSGSGSGGAGIGGPVVNITVHVGQNGMVIGGTKKDLAEAIGPEVANALKDLQARSRVNIFTGKAA